jgi:hypothetical protein
VSVAWQIVSLFIPIANFWAFYRIRKLRKYLLYIILPNIAITAVYLNAFFNYLPDYYLVGDGGLAFGDPYAIYQDPVVIATLAASYALFGFSIYLVVKWSREHNRKYDVPEPRSS